MYKRKLICRDLIRVHVVIIKVVQSNLVNKTTLRYNVLIKTFRPSLNLIKQKVFDTILLIRN